MSGFYEEYKDIEFSFVRVRNDRYHYYGSRVNADDTITCVSLFSKYRVDTPCHVKDVPSIIDVIVSIWGLDGTPLDIDKFSFVSPESCGSPP